MKGDGRGVGNRRWAPPKHERENERENAGEVARVQDEWRKERIVSAFAQLKAHELQR